MSGSWAAFHTDRGVEEEVGRLRWLAETLAALGQLYGKVSKLLAVVWRRSDHLMIGSTEADSGLKETTK
jgi:hypothetical protein